MKAVLCVAVQVVLCIGAMAFVELDECQRGPVEVETAKKNPDLRKDIRQHLGLRLDDDDIIARFMVNDRDFDRFANVFFAGRQKNDKALTFIYGSPDDGQNAQLIRIPFSKYYQYLGCTVHAVEEYSDS
ncbi:unnamed protein product [Heligmosomoides polygyrus]|uniref:Secreted protein n=1 Tax=Heligmosomoides polygyrus TaxID=6339 RepID=A0A183GRK2_HELPZ|nr:unnamed protein product [Heligmosomoides polygyrus]